MSTLLFLKLYFLSLAIFLAIDMLWLGVIAKNFYREQIGFLFADHVKWGPALLFYILFIGGLVFFCLWPAVQEQNAITGLLNGALFGLICYATYDLTNLATLKGWPNTITFVDLIWGTILSGLTCYLAYHLHQFSHR